uniref:Uncharacterized protein n=1 Tax=Romanomermis culicivorax TaxID=13658 RepID=A0A915K3I6_ROMCU
MKTLKGQKSGVRTLMVSEYGPGPADVKALTWNLYKVPGCRSLVVTRRLWTTTTYMCPIIYACQSNVADGGLTPGRSKWLGIRGCCEGRPSIVFLYITYLHMFKRLPIPCGYWLNDSATDLVKILTGAAKGPSPLELTARTKN